MRITDVKVPSNSTIGLKTIEMKRLGKVVVLVGKNGCGKTRMLQQLQSLLKEKPTPRQIATMPQTKANLEKQILKNEKSESNYSGTDPRVQLAELEEKMVWDKIQTSEQSEKYTLIDFIPKPDLLRNPADIKPSESIKMEEQHDNNISVENLAQTTLVKIQGIQDRAVVLPGDNSHDSDKNSEEYQRLKELIKIFLNADLDRASGKATLFGLELGEMNLSKGQLILLKLAIHIHSQEQKLTEVMICLDEPENHLHPQVIFDLISRLQSAVSNGQIWIATHSISLISQFDLDAIWYMEDGGIQKAGKIPEKVLKGLIGKDENIQKLNKFITFPEQFAMLNFSLDCLISPTAVFTGPDDPQTAQAIEELKRKSADNEPVRVLDFGAGKGRLLSAALELSKSADIAISSWLDYYALDNSNVDKQFCQGVISSAYGSADNRYFNCEGELFGSLKGKEFDFIVMCNVLHEINPTSWIDTIFSKNSCITKTLKDDGALLVIENQLLSVGEKAYDNGFLVFDEEDFKKAFKIESYDCRTRGTRKNLKAHRIPANCLNGISNTSIQTAVENINISSKIKIRNLRGQEGNFTYKEGLSLAFWAYQHLNSQLILDDFNSA